MMKVKDLIKRLKKMPQEYDVAIAMHDNGGDEIAGTLSFVDVLEGSEEPIAMGKDWVVLHCN